MGGGGGSGPTRHLFRRIGMKADEYNGLKEIQFSSKKKIYTFDERGEFGGVQKVAQVIITTCQDLGVEKDV